MKNEYISFSPIHPSDIDILEKWISKPHVQKWYFNPDLWIKKMQRSHGEDSLIHYNLIFHKCKPIGFAQWYDFCDFCNECNSIITFNNTYIIDYFIGDTKNPQKNLTKSIVKELKEIIIKLHPSSHIVVHPEIGNKLSQKKLLTSGYSFDKHTKRNFPEL